jgi:hypothetical protein
MFSSHVGIGNGSWFYWASMSRKLKEYKVEAGNWNFGTKEQVEQSDGYL